MKTKQSFFFLFLLLFLFVPLFSSAQFITTNAPCEPEIIPPLGQVAGVYCPYCANKGEYLHLKWDLKTNFQDPVCGIECWGPSGDQCYNWSSAEQWFDENGRSKTKLKPKDDVFIKGPPVSTRSAVPGTNLQVHCWEKNDASDPSKKKTSAGIRVYSDNACGEPAVCEERKFADIIADLTASRPTVITEKNLRGWSGYDSLDKAENGGSGSVADIMNIVVDRQNDSDVSSVQEEVFGSDGGVQNANRVLDRIREASNKRDAIPLDMVVLARKKNASTKTYDKVGLHVAISLGIKSHTKNYDKFELKILDPNYLDGEVGRIATIACRETRDNVSFAFNPEGYLIFEQKPFYIIKKFYQCSYPVIVSNGFGVGGLEYAVILMKYNSIDVASMSASSVRERTADYLSQDDNMLTFDNFATEPMSVIDVRGSNGGVCAAWVDFTLRTAYLGKFQDVDCHPDGTYTSKLNNSRLLSAISLLGKNFVSNFLKFDK